MYFAAALTLMQVEDRHQPAGPGLKLSLAGMLLSLQPSCSWQHYVGKLYVLHCFFSNECVMVG
jgi:hypothetical protein